MNRIEQIKKKDLAQEFQITASRSSGAGGQHVNKVNTKITLRFDVKNSALLDEEEKEVIIRKLGPRISADGMLIITAQSHRSQLQNKEEALLKFNQLLKKAFTFKKPRKASKPSKAAIRKRLDDKRRQSEKKKWRQKE